jgi:hypothetical protein
MTEKQMEGLAQICAAMGVLLWTGASLYFKLYPLTVLIAVTALPATIYNMVATKSTRLVRQ